MIRTLFIIFWTVILTGFFGVIVILTSFVSTGGETPHKVARIWAKCILAASNIKVTVKGLANLNPTGSYIYMPNHVSNFDIPVLQAYLPVQFRWLAKAELFKIPIFGYAMKRAGYISINRFDRKSAIQSLNKASETIRNGTSVIIFPEGTRSHNQNIQSFKKGGFVLAVDSGVPIIPVIIHGTWTIMQKKHVLVRPGNVILEIKKPINTLDYTRKTKDDLMEKVRNIILESYEKNKKNEMLC
ncbi:MAG: lysophospholipid acyltransferase family protein [Desulfobacterales bacterium]|jgi:1-acyl-sn-glycerol-3-phosphate acyltransferase